MAKNPFTGAVNKKKIYQP